MNTKLLLAALAVIFMVMIWSCENDVKRAKTFHGNRYIVIDTITIHDNTHEVLFWDSDSREGGMMHSPECWCKDKTFEI